MFLRAKLLIADIFDSGLQTLRVNGTGCLHRSHLPNINAILKFNINGAILLCGIIFYSFNAYGLENCVGKFNSAEWNACTARNEDRELQNKRYKEEQKMREDKESSASTKRYLDDIEKQKEREKIENEKNSEAAKNILNDLNREKNKKTMQLSEEEKIEVISELITMQSILSNERIIKSLETASKDKCKGLFGVLAKEERKMDKKEKAVLDNMRGLFSAGCDGNKLTEFKYYKKSADSGSIMGKVSLFELMNGK